MSAAGQGRRYGPTAQWLHWITVLLMLAIVVIAWQMVEIPRNTPARGLYVTAHKSIGIVILVLTLARLAWRARHAAPPLSPGMPGWMAWLAKANHVLLYVVLLGMPLAGYLHSATGAHAGSFFGLFELPALPRNDAVSDALLAVHLAGQWLLYAVVALHVLATVWHVAARRDGTLERMLPPQTGAP